MRSDRAPLRRYGTGAGQASPDPAREPPGEAFSALQLFVRPLPSAHQSDGLPQTSGYVSGTGHPQDETSATQRATGESNGLGRSLSTGLRAALFAREGPIWGSRGP
jgi:hypothetical protein